MEISRINQGGVVTSQHEITSKSSKIDVENKVATKSFKETESADELNLPNDAAQKVVEGLNNVMSAFDSHLKFVYHERLQKYYVTVVDSRTDEVVREIPPKKLLDFVASVNEQMGLIIDHKI